MILEDQLTLFQPGGTDYAHLINTGTPGFVDLPTALYLLGSVKLAWGIGKKSLILKIRPYERPKRNRV